MDIFVFVIVVSLLAVLSVMAAGVLVIALLLKIFFPHRYRDMKFYFFPRLNRR